MLRNGAGWLGLCGLYLTLAGDAGPHELATGAVVAGLLTLWASRVRARAERQFAGPHGLVRASGRALAALPAQTWRTGLRLIGAAFGRAHPGRALNRPFMHGTGAAPQERGRRAAAILLASLAPSSFVVRADAGRSEALLHVLGPDDAVRDPRWLV